MPRGVAALGLLCALLGPGSLWAAAAVTVAVRVTGVVPGGGRVFVSLCSGSFDPGDCGRAQVADGAAPTMVFVFPGVPAGAYGVAAFQDSNGNGTLDRSTHGLPLEPYGFSNEAGRTGAPRFERAAVPILRDTTIGVRLVPLRGRA